MHARTQILRFQKALYGRFQSSARSAAGTPSPKLKRYIERYRLSFRRIRAVLTKKAFLSQVFSSKTPDILICGDYHTLPQAQRTALELADALRRRISRGQKLVLALELLPSRYTPFAASYVAGNLTEADFLEKISYQKNWGFDWESYRPFFEFAQKHGLTVVGLNLATGRNAGTVQKRDEHAAQVLGQLRQNHPDAKVFVLFGDLHLAPAHLPKSLEKRFAKLKLSTRTVVIHQNAEPLYWKMVKAGHALDKSIADLGKNHYCLFTAAPWVKLQSYMDWLERSRPEQREESQDWSDTVDDIRRTLGRFFEIEKLPSAGFSIVDVHNPHQVAPIRKRYRMNRPHWSLVSAVLRVFPSFYIAEGKWLCVRRASQNQIASLTSSYLHSELCVGYPQLLNPRKDFYRWVWAEGMSFLGAKILNPNRQCWSAKDYQSVVKDPSAPVWMRATANYFEKEPSIAKSRLALPHYLVPNVGDKETRMVYILLMARAVGRVLGASLYEAYLRNQVSVDELKSLLAHPLSSAPQAARRYREWNDRLRVSKPPLAGKVRP